MKGHLTALLLWLCLTVQGADPGGGSAAALDLNGNPVDPFAESRNGTVLVFIQPDCPIANRYAPEIQRLGNAYSEKGIRFYLVYPDPDVTPSQVERHLKEYGYSVPALRDPRHVLVAKSRATVTPEAALFSPSGALLYNGRINDRFADFGKERPAAVRQDLREAIDSHLAGKKIAQRSAKPIGCYIPKLK